MADSSKPDAAAKAPDQAIDESRRRFLKRATVGLGALIGAAMAYPLARYFLFPMGRKTVVATDAPIDVLGLDDLPADGLSHKVTIIADDVRDAWGVANAQPIGSAWLRREGDQVSCLSAVCPHLGCAIDFEPGATPAEHRFRCPCHKSEFAQNGDKKSGPSKRGLDPLEVVVDPDTRRIKVRWRRFKADISEREEV